MRATDGFEIAHTLVLSVTDDMPFLVDSLSMAFSRAELAVHLIVHPVLQVRRDRRGQLIDIGANGAHATHPESWQLYEIDRVTDPEQLRKLQQDLESTLADVRAAVTDWRAMRERVREIITRLESDPPPLRAGGGDRGGAPARLDGRGGTSCSSATATTACERGRAEDRLLPDIISGLGILSAARAGAQRPRVTVLRGDVRTRAREPELLIVTKANAPATVHRAELLDYVGVKTFDSRGRVDGEHRFLGLWTSTAYHGSPRDIPVLRRKVERVIEHFGLDPASHDGKAVLNVLETYPRDELFQAGSARPHPHRARRGEPVRAPHRADAGAPRSVSSLLLLPGVRATRPLQHRGAPAHRADRARGLRRHERREPRADLRRQSRAACTWWCAPIRAGRDKPDFAGIEQRIGEAALTWADRLREVLVGQRGEAAGLALISRYRHAFPIAYQEGVPPAEVLEDLRDLEALRQQPRTLQLSLHRPAGQKPQRVHLRIVRLVDPVPISDVLPMLENFGLRVISEHPYELAWPEGGAAWIQDFELEHRDGLSRRHRARQHELPRRLRRRLERRHRERRLQPPAARRRPHRAPDRGAARLLPLPAADRRALQPDVHGARPRRQRRHRQEPRAAVPGALQSGGRPRRPWPRARSAKPSSRRSAPGSMRWRASTTIGSCAPT